MAKAWKQSIDEGLEKNPNADKADYEYVSVHWADLLYMHAMHDDKAFDFDKLYNDEPYITRRSQMP